MCRCHKRKEGGREEEEVPEQFRSAKTETRIAERHGEREGGPLYSADSQPALRGGWACWARLVAPKAALLPPPSSMADYPASGSLAPITVAAAETPL